MMNYTKEQEKAINDYLAVCIKNNYHCQHCAKNDNGVCFFAFQCFANDMMHFDDGEENYYIPCDGDCMECHEPCQMNQDIPDDVDETNYDPYCGCDMFEICGSIDEEW